MRRRRRRDFAGKFQRHHLLLDARRIAVWNVIQTFLLARFVGSKDPAQHAARQRIDAILEGRAQQRLGIEFKIFVGLTLEIEEDAESILNMIEGKAEPRRDPCLHERFGGGVASRTAAGEIAEAEDLQRDTERQRDVLIRQLHDLGELGISRRYGPWLRLEACSEDWCLSLIETF